MNEDIVVAAVESVNKAGRIIEGKLITPDHLESARGFDLSSIGNGHVFADAELGFAIYRRGDEHFVTSQGLSIDKKSVGPNRPLSIEFHHATPGRRDDIRPGNLDSQWVLQDLCGWSRFDGHDQNVAIVDTGITADLPDQLPRQSGHRDFYSSLGPELPTSDPVGHGTEMAGIIGARTAAGADRRSVAPACTIFAAQGRKEPDDEVTLAHMLVLLSWVFHCTPARAINMSLSLARYDWPGGIDLLSRAALRMRQSGKTLIFCVAKQAAADTDLLYPANADGFVAVGEYRQLDRAIVATNVLGAGAWTRKKDLFFAPASDLMTIRVDGSECNGFSGTSAACAFATGVSTLYFQAFRDEDAEAILERLRKAALPVDDDAGTGHGWNALRFPDDSVDGNPPRSGL